MKHGRQSPVQIAASWALGHQGVSEDGIPLELAAPGLGMCLIRDGALKRQAPPYFDRLEIGYLMESTGRRVTGQDVASFVALAEGWEAELNDSADASLTRIENGTSLVALLISYALGLLPVNSRLVLGLHSINSAELLRPVVVGDTIRIRAKVREKQPQRDDHGLVRLSVQLVNYADDLVLRMEVTLLWRRDPGFHERVPELSEFTDPPATPGVDIDDELSPVRGRRQ